MATTITAVIVVRAIIVYGAIQKRSHDPIYKNNKSWKKGLRATNFPIAILEKQGHKVVHKNVS